MSIRVIVLYIMVGCLATYAWKDWFKSLCGLLLLMAVMEHEDMPRAVMGIQGLNVWNVLFAMIFLAWAVNRGRQGLKWDMPRNVNVLLLMYLGVIFVGVLRAAFDRSYIQDYSLKSLFSEELINTFKWVLPGVLLFDGCRTRKQVVMALTSIIAMYVLIAVQVTRRVPLEAAFIDNDTIHYARMKIQNAIGYQATDLSAMLAGTSLGILAVMPLIRRSILQLMILSAAIIITVLGQALTGGRAGYAAWGATGLILCLLRWRKYLILVPVVLILLPVIFPGSASRIFMGFGATDITGQKSIDLDSITSGRTKIWPYVIDKIGESPVIGHGRLAMKRTGLYHTSALELNEGYGHPHNMYLETLLDNGILGSLPILLFWTVVIVYCSSLFLSENCLYSAVGGVALALSLTQLFAGVGAQHVYPNEGIVGMWAAVFLAMRVHVEKRRFQEASINASVVPNGEIS